MVFRRQALICIVFGALFAACFSSAPETVLVTPPGLEGFYYATPPISVLEGPWCLSISPVHGSERVRVGIIVGDSQHARRFTQYRFDQATLEGATLTATGCKINGLTVALSGRFVASDPYLHSYPEDTVILRGTISFHSDTNTEVFEDVAFTYDSGL